MVQSPQAGNHPTKKELRYTYCSTDYLKKSRQAIDVLNQGSRPCCVANKRNKRTTRPARREHHPRLALFRPNQGYMSEKQREHVTHRASANRAQNSKLKQYPSPARHQKKKRREKTKPSEQTHLELYRGLKRRRKPRPEGQDDGLLACGGAGSPDYPALADLQLLSLCRHLVQLVPEEGVELVEAVAGAARVTHHRRLVVDRVGGLREGNAEEQRAEGGEEEQSKMKGCGEKTDEVLQVK